MSYNRRHFLLGSVTAITAGCISTTGTTDPERVKEEATSPGYEEMYRNNSEYEGDPVTFVGIVTDIVETSETGQEFLFDINPDEPRNAKILYCNWGGDPYRKDDQLRIWGTVNGLESYRSLSGEVTVPEIDIVEIETLGF